MEKWKLYKEKSAHLNITRLPKAEEEMELESDSDFECELRSEQGPQDRGEQYGAMSGVEEVQPSRDPVVQVQAAANFKAGQQGEVGGGSWTLATQASQPRPQGAKKEAANC